MRKQATPLAFARATSSAADSRTCPTLPGAEPSARVGSVRTQPTPPRAVQVRGAGRAAERRAGGDGGERPRLLAAGCAGAGGAGARLGEHLLDHRAPRAAARALPEPARGRMAALLADEGRAPRLVNHASAPG